MYKQIGYPDSYNIHSWRRRPRRDTVQLLGQALESQLLMTLATSDLYWDRIVSIEYMGDHPVYDLTVPETHNFVANDMLVHNTALCLNIAQYAALIKAQTSSGRVSLVHPLPRCAAVSTTC